MCILEGDVSYHSREGENLLFRLARGNARSGTGMTNKENFMSINKFVNVICKLRKFSNHCLLPTSYCLLISLFLALPAFSAQSSFDLMERANALYRDGKFKQAIMLYHKAQDRGADPVAVSEGNFAPALFNMASVYFRLKQFPECIAVYHRALKLDPDNISGWLYLGEAYTKTGDKVGALRAIENAYRLDKNDVSIVYQLSEANIALNDFDRAVAVIREGYALHPEETDFLVYLGDVYRLNKNFEESANAYREALGVKIDDTQIMYKLADVLAEDKKPYIAMEILNNILQIKPDFSDAAIFMGNLAYDAKFNDRAEYAYELAAKNGNAEAVFGFKNMAYDAHAQKRNDEAVRLLNVALKYYPNDATVQADLAEMESAN